MKTLLLIMTFFFFSLQNVFCENDKVVSSVNLPYYYHHFSECRNDELLIDTLLAYYDEYTREQQVNVIDFMIDSLMSEGLSFRLENFISYKINPSELTETHKRKIMDIALKYKSIILITFFGKLNEKSFIPILRDFWKSNQKSSFSRSLESTLFRLGDSIIIEKWMSYMEKAPKKRDTLSISYYNYFEDIIENGKNKKVFDRLLLIMLTYPNKQMRVDYAYPCCYQVFEPLSMFFYRSIFRYIKDAPIFDNRMKNRNVIKKDDVMYYNFPEEYKQKYLNWIKEHIDDYEFVE